MNNSLTNMNAAFLAENHPLFFDLDFVRKSDLAARELSDAQLWNNLINPNNPTPFRPNVIFDSAYYAQKHSDHLKVEIRNPILHYLLEGEALGLDPNPYFEPSFYEANIAGERSPSGTFVEHALANISGTLAPFHPFIDAQFCYKQTGAEDLRSFYEGMFQDQLNPLYPHPLFDGTYLMGRPPMHLQEAFNAYWAAEDDLSTHPLFDPSYYKSQLEDGEKIRHSVFHYLVSSAPTSPHPLFDMQFYSNRLFQQKSISVDRPFEHYLTQGVHLDIDPSPFFDATFYRAQSGCKTDALLDYVQGGYEKYSPHPMIHRSKSRLFRQALFVENEGISSFREWYEDLPLQATPDFDPVFFSNPKGHKSPPLEMRNTYLENGYLEGEKPNGLLSLNYISAQIPAISAQSRPAISSYFQKGFQQRTRVLLAFQSMDDTASMQAWLALLQSQILHPDFEFIVVAPCEGPLTQAFSKVAHIWHLGVASDTDLSVEKLMQSSQRLREVIQGNPPKACFVQVTHSTDIARVFAKFNYPVTAFFDAGFSMLSKDDIDVLNHFRNGAFVRTKQEKSALVQQGVAETNLHVGLVGQVLPLISPEVRQSARIKTRAKLGVSDDDVLIVSNGNLDLESGVDVFGAVLAQLASSPTAPAKIKFLWHGKGLKHPNTPVFYARHFLRSVGVEDKLILLEEGPLEESLCAADIYLDVGRSEQIAQNLVLAKAVGLPIVSFSRHSDIRGTKDESGVLSADAFDIDSAVDSLVKLSTDAKLRTEVGDNTQEIAASELTVGRFIDRVNEALKPANFDIPHLMQPERTTEETVLVFIAPKLLQPLDDKLPNLNCESLPTVFKNLLVDFDNTQLTFQTDVSELTGSFVATFKRSLCFFPGTSKDVQDIYRVGLFFDEIFVENERAIEEIQMMNPLISKKMTAMEVERD